MRGRPQGKAPDYTDAVLATGLVNLIWIFFALWAVFGFWTVLLAGLVLNVAISRLAARLSRN